jgi:hypothetical protein
MARKYCGPDVRCIVTGKRGGDLHHIKSRGAGGTDESFNMIPLSHELHQEWHMKGTHLMAEKYVAINEWLRENGWYICLVKKKWVHD